MASSWPRLSGGLGQEERVGIDQISDVTEDLHQAWWAP